MSGEHAQPPPAPDALDAVLADAWQQLAHGAASAKHGFHLPTLATVTPGGKPASRIVVLRAVDAVVRGVVAHTDLRSPKVEHLQHQGFASWVFYDAPRRIQVRLAGQTEVLSQGAVADERWQQSNDSSRRCYLAPAAPGTPTDYPSPNLPAHVRDRVPTADETEPGRANFAVIRTVAATIDVLYLHHTGHRRAGFQWDADGSPRLGSWVEV